MSIYDWSTTAGNNASVGSINWSENQAPSTVNNSSRAEMADVKGFVDFLSAAKIATGTDTLALTSGLTLTAYSQGMMFAFENTTQNTGAVTLNVDTIAAKAVVKNHDVALASGDLEAGGIYLVAYEATADNFQLLSAVSNAPGDLLASNNLSEVTAATAADNLTAMRWGKHTIFVPAAAMRATTSNGAAALNDVETTAGRPDMTAFDFDATADEHVQFQVAMPKSYNLGTVTAQFFWESTAADTDGVTWAIQGVAISDNVSIDTAYGTAVTVDDANQSAAEELLVSAESGAVTIAGTPADDDMCFFRVFRDVSDANDTATEDARLIGCKLFITTDAGTDA